MPTYEYACKSCGEHLEVVQSFTDEPLTTCPACAGPLRKVFGNIGISFKGTGFYKNDSRSSTRSGSSGSSGESAAGSGSGSSESSSPAKESAPSTDAAKPKETPSAPKGAPSSSKESGGPASRPAAAAS